MWRWTKERMQQAHDTGLIHYSSTGLASQKRYLGEMQGNPVDTIWEDDRYKPKLRNALATPHRSLSPCLSG